jgi:putative membrane protein
MQGTVGSPYSRTSAREFHLLLPRPTRNSIGKEYSIKEETVKAKTLKTLAIILGGAAYFSTGAFAGTGQHNTEGASVPASRDTSGQTSMPGSGSGTGGSGSPGSAQGATTTSGAVTTPDAAQSQASMSMSDSDILAIMTAIDDNEIAAAGAAQKEKLGAKAKDYAKMLKKQHTANSDKTKKLSKKTGISPSTTNQTAMDLRAKGAGELATLVPLQGKEFEKAYIDAMVTGHTEALQVIDAQLLPAAKNDEVRAQVDEMRGHVSHHLEEGKRLQEVQASRAE